MLEESDLRREIVQLAVREATALALETPLRDPILEAVERTNAGGSTGQDRTDSDRPVGDGTALKRSMDERADAAGGGSSALRRAVTAVAVVAAGYAVVRWLANERAA